jgi:hypothetical protein
MILSLEEYGYDGDCSSSRRVIPRWSEDGSGKGFARKARIYAVLGLPEKLFYNTTIPTVILILRKTGESKQGHRL